MNYKFVETPGINHLSETLLRFIYSPENDYSTQIQFWDSHLLEKNPYLVKIVESVRPWNDVSYIGVFKLFKSDNSIVYTDNLAEGDSKYSLYIPLYNCVDNYLQFYSTNDTSTSQLVGNKALPDALKLNKWDRDTITPSEKLYLRIGALVNLTVPKEEIIVTDEPKIVLSVRFATPFDFENDNT